MVIIFLCREGKRQMWILRFSIFFSLPPTVSCSNLQFLSNLLVFAAPLICVCCATWLFKHTRTIYSTFWTNFLYYIETYYMWCKIFRSFHTLVNCPSHSYDGAHNGNDIDKDDFDFLTFSIWYMQYIWGMSISSIQKCKRSIKFYFILLFIEIP